MLTEFDSICAICGRPKECTHHLIPGTGKRKISTKYDITMPLCNRCHNMGNQAEQIHGTALTMQLSKMLGQLLWERDYIAGGDQEEIRKARAEFMKTYGESYL